MKKSYQIEVDCAACAQKMEEATKRTEGVKDCVVNFMTQKMIVEFDEGADPKAVMTEVRRACQRVEPDCEVKKAVEEGRFNKNRYERYLTIYEEIKQAEKNKF